MSKHIIAFILSLCTAGAGAQSVGLVLSGGGAKGLYHIGVIQALEENNIPVDYISGTSMGAIVGGLYAIGFTPEEMKREFLSPQVRNWLTGQIAPEYVYYFKNMNRNASMLNLRLDLSRRKGSRLPSSLVQSSQLDMAFVEYFSAAGIACGGDFDKLFIPFRCVATDVLGRKAVTYRSGDLGKAIRSSMSIPLVFKPIHEDSTVLYDGGIMNNFPWQVLDGDFGPDVLIGSKCVEGHRNPEDNSMIDQVFNLTMMSTDYSLPEGRSVMVDHIFDNVSVMDFDKADYIIRKGYEDAMAGMDDIKALIARRTDPGELAARRAAFKASQPGMLFSNYRVTGLGLRQSEYVGKLLGLDETTETYSFDEFKTNYLKLLSENEFETLYPETDYDAGSGAFRLSIPMSTSPSFRLKIGGNISSTALNQAYLGIEYKTIGRTAQSYNFDGYFSPFYTSASLTSRADFFIRVPFFVEYGISYNFYNYFRSNYGFISKGRNLTYSKYEDSFLTAAIGIPVGRRSALTLRANAATDNYKYYQRLDYNDDDPMDNTRFSLLSSSLELERNSIPNAYSNRGLRQNISLMGLTGRETFTPNGNAAVRDRLRSERRWFGGRFMREEYFHHDNVRWLSWGYLLEGVYTSHPDFFNEYASNMTSPAFTPTPHSKIVYIKEYRSPSYIGAGLMPSVQFMPNLYLKCSAYAFLPDNLEGRREGIEQRLRYIFDAALIYQTYIGPVSLSLSKYDVGRNNWFLTFNFGYAIFNRKSVVY